MSFGVLTDPFPFLPIIRRFFSVINSHNLYMSLYTIFSLHFGFFSWFKSCKFPVRNFLLRQCSSVLSKRLKHAILLYLVPSFSLVLGLLFLFFKEKVFLKHNTEKMLVFYIWFSSFLFIICYKFSSLSWQQIAFIEAFLLEHTQKSEGVDNNS
jgi:hypothetical protein